MPLEWWLNGLLYKASAKIVEKKTSNLMEIDSDGLCALLVELHLDLTP